MRDALIHRARFEGFSSTGERNAQGERLVQPIVGPWVPARFMEVGIAAERRRQGASSTARGFELLADYEDEAGAPFELKASMRLRVIAEPVTPAAGWLVEVDGDPERLNDGEEMIGWMGRAVRAEDTR